jgi:hypothetical protein
LDKAITHARENHEITWEKRLVRARTLKEMSRKKDPYGESKTEAVKQAKELREKGEKARVIETSKSKDLYAPFVGTFKMDKEGNILEATVRPNTSPLSKGTPKQGVVKKFTGRKVEDEIVLETTEPVGTQVKWIFFDIGIDSFRWRSEHSYDEGKIWKKIEDMFIVRQN